MLIKVFGAAVQGIDATLITIEVNSSRGCMFYLVGLPDSAVKESHQRIISALQVNGYRIPTSNIVINMAPADIRKEGSAYDLPLAIGMLAAGEVIQSDKLNRYLMMGELSLDGSLQPIKGALPIAIKARELGFEGIIVPRQNAREAAVVNKIQVYGVENIKEVIEFFNGNQELTPTIVNTREEFYAQQSDFDLDFSDVKGQENVKRALEVAAGTWIHGGNQHKAGRVFHIAFYTGDSNFTVFQWLAENFQHTAIEFRKFIQKQNAIMCQTYFTGLWITAASCHRYCRNSMVRITKRAFGDKPCICLQSPCH